MEVIAVISHLAHYILAAVAIVLCVILYRRQRKCGWLLVGTVFREPFVLLVMRAIHGRPLFSYKTQSLGSDGVLHINYQWDFPVLYVLAVIGLYLLVRDMNHDTSA